MIENLMLLTERIYKLAPPLALPLCRDVIKFILIIAEVASELQLLEAVTPLDWAALAEVVKMREKTVGKYYSPNKQTNNFFFNLSCCGCRRKSSDQIVSFVLYMYVCMCSSSCVNLRADRQDNKVQPIEVYTKNVGFGNNTIGGLWWLWCCLQRNLYAGEFDNLHKDHS